MKRSNLSIAIALAMGLGYGAIAVAGDTGDKSAAEAVSAEDGTLENRPQPEMGTAGGDAVAGDTFGALDLDSDDYISKEEASADAAITDNWDTADKDADGRLDRSEFSAFESGGESQAPKMSDEGETGMSDDADESPAE